MTDPRQRKQSFKQAIKRQKETELTNEDLEERHKQGMYGRERTTIMVRTVHGISEDRWRL